MLQEAWSESYRYRIVILKQVSYFCCAFIYFVASTIMKAFKVKSLLFTAMLLAPIALSNKQPCYPLQMSIIQYIQILAV